ncbi:MAG: isocitrate/isopropylmalate family dehydrogenase [Acidobacteria bacterium]|jgi:3-isopropylmalate dehydrogenase|nr:isocitrate/isopropylmalate family dehydrogenase [Acidobacteriota bacterium]
MHIIAVIGGDGVGPEVMRETLKVARVLGEKYQMPIEFEEFPFGADYYLEKGITIPENVFHEWPKKYSAILLGAFGDPRVKSNAHAEAILMGFRLKLDLYVNYRPVYLINKEFCPLKHVTDEKQVNFVVFRENTEDLYINVGGTFKKDTREEIAIENSIHSYKGVERILRSAFEYAQEKGRTSVVMGHKGNAMKNAGNLWNRIFFTLGKQYPNIETKTMYIDALCMDIIKNPWNYSVIVTSNMFGDILTDVAAQIQGGIGLAASANYNAEDKKFFGVFEPVHGSAPDIAGKNICNPMASLLSYCLLLRRLGLKKEAQVIYDAIAEALMRRKVTPDLGGELSTTAVADFICEKIKETKIWV